MYVGMLYMNERNSCGKDHGFKIADGYLKKTKQNCWKWLNEKEKSMKKDYLLFTVQMYKGI